MKVSVILCTHNRCQLLPKTLESIGQSALPESIEWEVLVVDNHSTDRTRELAEEFCRKHTDHFRYLYEPNPGKSHALNAGIRAAKGEILAFTDDDVTVDPAWLQNLTASLSDGKWAGVAGRILPEKGFSPPRWIPRDQKDALAPLAILDMGREAGPFEESPFGANAAYQKRLFEKYGGFRTDLGPGGQSGLQKSEDNEFGHRMLVAGEKLLYEPSAIVYHPVPKERLNQAYFLKWWFDKSRSDILAFGVSPECKRFIFGVPVLLCRRILVWSLRWMFAFHPAQRFSCKVKIWWLAGGILESYRSAHARTCSQAMQDELQAESLKNG